MTATSDPAAAGGPVYEERLTAPASYWVIGLVVGVSTATAVGFYLGPWVAVAAGIAVAGGLVFALLALGHVRIVVDDRGLAVGAALLEWPYQGEAVALDPAAARDRLGAGADARAFVVARPYLPSAVLVPVVDAADPHPYWLVSSRNPRRLAAALAAGRAAGVERR
nr:DUF3093 domain-containing protein [Propionibacterium sp.]